MRVNVTVHGMLTAAVDDPDGRLTLSVPYGIDIRGVVEILAQRSPLFDPRACLATVDGVKVPLDRVLGDGEVLDLYLLFGGG
jgi:hypothetical protein